MSFVALLTIAVLTELACSWLAYRTIGATASHLLAAAVGFNVATVFLFAIRRRLLAVAQVAALVAAYLPYQAELGHRLVSLHGEAGSIVRCLNESHRESWQYPDDLAAHAFCDESLRQNFDVNPAG